MTGRYFKGAALLAALAVTTTLALAQTFPSKPIRWVVGYAAGGGSDFVARTVGQAWQDQIGQTVLVDNKPGANTAIAASDVGRAPPDGYTAGFVDNGTMVLNPMLYKRLVYDPKKDLQTVTQIGRMPGVLVVNRTWGANINSVQDYVRRAKENPGSITYGSPGAGNVFHLGMELFNSTAGIHTVHSPYRGAAPAMQDLVAGNIQVMLVDLATSSEFIKSGKIKALAVSNATRLASLPNVPTFEELGYPGVEVAALQGIVVPTGTPPEIIASLNKSAVAAIRSPAVSKKLSDFGIEPVGGSPKAFADVLAEDRVRWQKVVDALKLTLD